MSRTEGSKVFCLVGSQRMILDRSFWAIAHYAHWSLVQYLRFGRLFRPLGRSARQFVRKLPHITLRDTDVKGDLLGKLGNVQALRCLIKVPSQITHWSKFSQLQGRPKFKALKFLDVEAAAELGAWPAGAMATPNKLICFYYRIRIVSIHNQQASCVSPRVQKNVGKSISLVYNPTIFYSVSYPILREIAMVTRIRLLIILIRWRISGEF